MDNNTYGEGYEYFYMHPRQIGRTARFEAAAKKTLERHAESFKALAEYEAREIRGAHENRGCEISHTQIHLASDENVRRLSSWIAPGWIGGTIEQMRSEIANECQEHLT